MSSPAVSPMQGILSLVSRFFFGLVIWSSNYSFQRSTCRLMASMCAFMTIEVPHSSTRETLKEISMKKQQDPS